MLLLSHLRCRSKVLELFLGCLLARQCEFATPGAVRSTVAPQRPPLRRTLYVPFSHPGMLIIADAAPRDLQRLGAPDIWLRCWFDIVGNHQNPQGCKTAVFLAS